MASVNYPGTPAYFNNPQGLAVDSSTGEVYVADTYYSLVRKVNCTTNLATNLAGSGEAKKMDGKGPQASFRYPRHLVVVNSTFLYIADTYSNTIRSMSS